MNKKIFKIIMMIVFIFTLSSCTINRYYTLPENENGDSSNNDNNSQAQGDGNQPTNTNPDDGVNDNNDSSQTQGDSNPSTITDPDDTTGGNNETGGSNGSSKRVRRVSKELPVATEYLDVSLTYGSNNLFITADQNFYNPIEGLNYTKDNCDLLPVWKKFARVLSTSNKYGVGRSITIRDGIKHEKKSPADRFATDRQNQFKTTNANNKGEDIDLYQNTTANINWMGVAGECLNLLDYIDYMPNFKAYLDANPVIEDQMTVEGKIFYTPYMDGSNYYETMFQMDAAMTKKLLDHGKYAGFDTTCAVDAKRVNFTANKVTPFINDTKNYPTDNYEVKICVDGKAETVKIKQTDNIIAQQNALLADASKTGADLAKQFIDYLNTAYGNIEVNGTKIYSTLSKVFVGESAIYNTDDLIALFRVFRANPAYISGGSNDTIYPFQIRTSENYRVENILSFAGNLFGVQGLNSEKDRLFFTTDGFWADAATEQQSYDALARMNALYQEGLILKGFQQGAKTQWGNNAFARNTGAATYGLMLNDYTAVPSKMNALDENGVGINNQTNGFQASELQPILAPITWWATDSFAHGQPLNYKVGKTLIRYYESIRSLREESWCVPSNSDNKLAAIKLMDYLMSKEGQVYFDFCTEDYWATDSTNTSGEFPGYVEFSYGGDTTPQLKQEVLDWYTTSPISDFNNFWKFLRGALGCSFGVGYIRTSTIDYQSTNLVARQGADALKAATNAGVNMKSNLISEVKFGTAVPAAGYPEITDEIAMTYDAVTQFWNQRGKGQVTNSYGWVAAVQDPNFGDSTVLGTLSEIAGSCQYTFADVKEQFDARNNCYLYNYARYFSEIGLDIGNGYGKIPTYLNRVKVHFDTLGGSLIDDIEIDKGSSIEKPQNPTKEGYVFLGWSPYVWDGDVQYYDSEFFDYYFSMPIYRFTTFYAVWDVNPNYVVVKFDSQGGSIINDKAVVKGTPVSEPEDPIKYGYKFLGWYKEETCKNEWYFETNVHENRTLYAKWKQNDGSSETEGDKFTVKFDTQGGSKIDDVKVDKNTAVAQPADPTRNGYEFQGWYKEKACTNAWDFTKPITEDKTLYAKWEQKDMITGIELTGTFRTRYKKGETFDPTGLVVTELHTKDDDVVLTSDKYTITVADEAGNSVATNAPFATAGYYTATVKATASNKTSDFDFKVTNEAETLVDYDYSPDTYGTAKGLTTANDSLTANEAIASLSSGRITLTATGAKTKYQQIDSNGNSVVATYNNVIYGSRIQVNTGVDGAVKLYVASDAQVTLYAKGDIGRGIKITNTDTTLSERDPHACDFVEEDGNKEVMRVFEYYLNAGTYNINSTSGGGVNIYNFIISLYEPTFDPTAPITDLEFSGQRTKFYEMDSLNGITLDQIVDGIVIKSTRDEVSGNAVNKADCTFALYKGETQVTEFSDAGSYSVKVTVEGYSKSYPITYYKATKFELTSPYKTITVQRGSTSIPILGNAKLTYDNDSKIYQYLSADPAYVTVQYYTTKTDNVYSGEIDATTALGTNQTVYAGVTFNDALLPLSCLSDTEAGNVKTIYFTVNVADEAPSIYWNCHFVAEVNQNSLLKGSKQDLAVTNETLASGVTVDTGTYKSDDSLDCIGLELAKNNGGKITFVVPTGKVATIKINAGSTNSSNATDNIYLKLGDNVVAGSSSGTGVVAGATTNTFKITGNSADSILTYSNLAAGSYTFGTAETARGMRVFSFEITLADA